MRCSKSLRRENGEPGAQAHSGPAFLQESHGVCERRACAAIRQPRGTQLYGGQRRVKDAVLAAHLAGATASGYRMATVQTRRAGMMVNAKRVQRLWRQEGLEGAAPATQAAKARPQREGHAAKEGDAGQ